MKPLKGVEIFHVGTWNGVTLNENDLDSVVNSFMALSLDRDRVPLKLGHDGPDQREDPMSQLALGWVRKVWREDKVLKADFEMPDKVHDLVKDGFLSNVSVELLRNVRADTRVIPWVLDAVALLGTEQPAVGILNNMRSVLLTRKTAHAAQVFDSRTLFTRETTEDPSMDEIEKLKTENARLLKERDEEKSQRETFAKQVLKEKADDKRAKVAELFNEAIKEDRILPSVRETFTKYQCPRKEDDAAWAEFDVKLVEEAIEANLKPGAKRFSKKGAQNPQEEQVDEAEKSMTAGQKVTHRVNKLAFARKENLGDPEVMDRLTKHVLAESPELAEARTWEPENIQKGAR